MLLRRNRLLTRGRYTHLIMGKEAEWQLPSFYSPDRYMGILGEGRIINKTWQVHGPNGAPSVRLFSGDTERYFGNLGNFLTSTCKRDISPAFQNFVDASPRRFKGFALWLGWLSNCFSRRFSATCSLSRP